MGYGVNAAAFDDPAKYGGTTNALSQCGNPTGQSHTVVAPINADGAV